MNVNNRSSPNSAGKVTDESLETYAKKLTSRIAEEERVLREKAEKLRHDRERLELDIAQFERVSKKLNDVQLSTPINLNVGGKRFSTTMETLQKDRNSFFGAMFGGGFEPKLSIDGSYFIDRDGTHFRYILNFLRDGRFVLPKGDDSLAEELLIEAQFYQIQGIVDILQPTQQTMQQTIQQQQQQQQQPLHTSLIFKGSIILSDSSFSSKLNEWSGDQPNRRWKLIYRGSRDGFRASSFHTRCDEKGSTFIILKSGNNIFGGYNHQSWMSPASGGISYSSGKGCFLFTLVNPFKIPPTKLPNSDPNHGASNHREYGPCFGVDLLVNDHCSEVGGCRSTLGSYVNPTPHRYLFTGQEVFPLNEIEVFIRLPE